MTRTHKSSGRSAQSNSTQTRTLIAAFFETRLSPEFRRNWAASGRLTASAFLAQQCQFRPARRVRPTGYITPSQNSRRAVPHRCRGSGDTSSLFRTVFLSRTAKTSPSENFSQPQRKRPTKKGEETREGEKKQKKGQATGLLSSHHSADATSSSQSQEPGSNRTPLGAPIIHPPPFFSPPSPSGGGTAPGRNGGFRERRAFPRSWASVVPRRGPAERSGLQGDSCPGSKLPTLAGSAGTWRLLARTAFGCKPQF